MWGLRRHLKVDRNYCNKIVQNELDQLVKFLSMRHSTKLSSDYSGKDVHSIPDLFESVRIVLPASIPRENTGVLFKKSHPVRDVLG